MRLRIWGAWKPVTCLGSLLTLVAGCQLPDFGDKGKDDNSQDKGDPSNINPGQGQNGNQNGGVGLNGQSAPLARKLALDLSGVAGFAILGQDSTTGGTTTGTGGTSTPTSGSAVTPGAGGSPSASIWLSSTATGQVLTAAAPSSVAAQRVAAFVGRTGLQPLALGNSPVPGSGIAQSDPGAAPAGSAGAPSGGNAGTPSGAGGGASGSGTAPSGTASNSPTTGDSNADVGEQAGLLKITDDGSIKPALVALADDASGASAGGAAGAAGGGADAGTAGGSGAPSDGTGGASGAGGDGAKPVGASTGGAAQSGAAGAAPGTAGGNVPNQPIQNPGFSEPMPRVTAVGLSPDGSVYVLFERGFVYRQPTTEELSSTDFNPGSPTSPFRCQLFRADGSWKNGAPAAKNLAELECVTSDYQVPTWDTKKVMQFDASGKLYFRAVTTGNPQGVFVQFDPVTKQLSEKVNANICWHDVQVTPRGSLFYTGTSGSNGDCSGGNGTSFFRYVSADNHLTEIARDWWNFKYLAEQDPADPNNERIIFYGPDPNATSNVGWDSACLYRYDPGIATVADRPQKLVECFSDANSYVNGTKTMGPSMPQAPTPDQLPGYQDRCESSGQLFIGGDGVTAISQLEDGTLFVVGTFQHKLAGVLQCGIDIQADHCALIGNGAPGDAIDTVNTNSTDCANAGHQWVHIGAGCSNPEYSTPDTCSANQAQWNPGGGGLRHYEMTGSGCAASIDGSTLQHINCQAPNNTNSLSEQVTGLGYLVPGVDGAPGTIRLLSDPTEHVEHYWPVPGAHGPELYYSVYAAGQYNLRRVTQLTSEGQSSLVRSSVLDDYEVYNLQRDPSAANRVLFDALEFSTNSYVFGSIDPSLASPADVKASLRVSSGVSGRVETLVILPDF